MSTVDDEAVVDAAVSAAEEVILSRYNRSEIRDLDLSISFAEGHLDIDIYLDAPGDASRVADDAALAARAAVDEILDV